MTREELQCLLSLSGLSIFGPRYDIDELSRQGFYKKKGLIDHQLEVSLPINDPKFLGYQMEVTKALGYCGIRNKEEYSSKILELLGGSLFSEHMDKLMQLGRMMTKDQIDKMEAIMIDCRPYSKTMLNLLLKYRNHWPLQGLRAYDIANGIFLLRIGLELEYITISKQEAYFEKFLSLVKSNYQSFREFGIDASIGRYLHICSLELTKSNQLPKEIKSVLSECYYSIWQYLPKEVMA